MILKVNRYMVKSVPDSARTFYETIVIGWSKMSDLGAEIKPYPLEMNSKAIDRVKVLFRRAQATGRIYGSSAPGQAPWACLDVGFCS